MLRGVSADERTRSAPPPSSGPRPDEASGSRRRRRLIRGLILLTAGLLVLNYWAASRATQGQARERIPYSPFFLDQVRAGKVAEIKSRGNAIQGTFRRPLRYNGSKPTTRFKTEIPAFADTNALSRLLERKN